VVKKQVRVESKMHVRFSTPRMRVAEHIALVTQVNQWVLEYQLAKSAGEFGPNNVDLGFELKFDIEGQIHQSDTVSNSAEMIVVWRNSLETFLQKLNLTQIEFELKVVCWQEIAEQVSVL
jgi:hypothetical protein